MDIRHVPDFENQAMYSMYSQTDFEFVNPIEYTAQSIIKVFSEEEIVNYRMRGFPDNSLTRTFAKRNAERFWMSQHKHIRSTKIPKPLIDLLQAISKKEQERLLRGLRFTPEQLMAFVFMAYDKYRYSYSFYSGEHHHKGFNEADLPSIVEVQKDGSVNHIGKTRLSDGQLKQAVKQRIVTKSKFIDKGNNWHCFFTTYKSLRGEENWKDGQPHYHYISDKFTIDRNEVVIRLKSREYKLGSLPHIDLLDYRKD